MVNLCEVINIYNEKIVTDDDIKKNIKYIYKKNKTELANFKVLTLERLLQNKDKLFVRYIPAQNYINNKLNYGGFLIKFTETTITLLSTKKNVWSINIDDNFIFYTKVLSENDKTRKAFEEYLKENEKNK